MPSDALPITLNTGGTTTVSEFPISFDEQRLLQFCETYRIAELSLFGSVTRDDFNPASSDVDVLVEFEPC